MTRLQMVIMIISTSIAFFSAYTCFYNYLKYDLDFSDEDAEWLAIWFAELFAEWHADATADSYWDAYANIDYGYESEYEYTYTYTYNNDFYDKLTRTNICDLVEDHSSDGYAEWFAIIGMQILIPTRTIVA